MKRYLLLSLAAGSLLTATAAQPAFDGAAKTAAREKATVKSEMSVSNKFLNAKQINSVAKSKYSIAKGAASIKKAPVSDENQPYYMVPGGNMFFGFIPLEAQNYIGFSGLSYSDGSTMSELFGAAFANQTWHNASSYAENTDFTNAFTWNFQDPEANYDTATTSEINLVTNYPYAEVDCPLLEFDEKEYQAALAAKFGGTPYQKLSSGETVLTASMPFNIGVETNDFGYAQYYTIDSSTWSQIYGAPIEHAGIGMIVEQPEHPYGLFSVYFCGVVDTYVSKRMNVKVYKLSLDEESRYVLGDVIASGHINKENIPTSANKYVMFPIPLTVEDGELSYEDYVNIDTPVYIAFDGFDVAAGDKAYLGGAYTTDIMQMELGTGVNLVKYQGNDLLISSALEFQSGDVCGNLSIGLENFFTWMDPETEETAYEAPEVWNVPAEGGSKTFTYSPFYDLNELGKVEGRGAYDWWEAGAEEYNETAGTQDLVITVDPLPAGETGRYATATISIPGAYRKITIIQGEVTGIDNVTAAEAAELDWNAPVYNVMGQKVSQGYTGIAIQNGKKFIVK